MAFHLVVAHAFPGYQVGQMVVDEDEVARILSGPNEHNVVKRNFSPPGPKAIVAEQAKAVPAQGKPSA